MISFFKKANPIKKSPSRVSAARLARDLKAARSQIGRLKKKVKKLEGLLKKQEE